MSWPIHHAGCVAALSFAATGCGGAVEAAAPTPTLDRRAEAETPRDAPRLGRSADIAIPVPEGYADVTFGAAPDDPGIVVVLAATPDPDVIRTITVRKVPIPGGSFADEATCAETGAGLVSREPSWTLVSVGIIAGPLGDTCQVRIRAPEGIAVITELHLPGNTPRAPKDVWVLVCNHAEGDIPAETTCRSTVDGFRLLRD
jgi:hypothetical protein